MVVCNGWCLGGELSVQEVFCLEGGLWLPASGGRLGVRSWSGIYNFFCNLIEI